MIVAVSVCAAGLVASSPVRGASSDAYMVKDINPGPTCTAFGRTGTCGGVSDRMNATAMGSSLFFTADDGLYGRELWKSDGTTASTVLVKDINT
jgi:ELWxxDGT repeat protein